MFRLIFLLVLVLDFSLAIKQEQLPICKKSNSTTDLCTLVENYNPLHPPTEPQPCLIEPRVVISTIEINEKTQVLTLLMELKLRWIDNGLNLKNYHSSWFQLNGWHFELELVDYHSDWFQIDGTNFKIWHPSLYFENLVDIKKLIGYGADHNVQFWFNRVYQRYGTLLYILKS